MQQSYRISQAINDRIGQAYALTLMGQVLIGLDRLTEAEDVYRRALDLRDNVGDDVEREHLMMAMLAGLAHVALLQGELDQARAHAEEVLAYISQHPDLPAIAEPFGLYWITYRVLGKLQDPRAPQVLAAAYKMVRTRADALPDKGLRRSFLCNVLIHQAIVKEWEDKYEGHPD